MRVVVTGASGNLGTALLRRLAGDTERHEVVGVVRRPPSGPPYDGVEWVGLDLAADAAAARLTEVSRGADAVVHLAWLFQPARDVAYLQRVGVGGTRAVVAAVEAAGVPHLVHMSSLGAYSPGPQDGDTRDGGVDESWPTGGVPSLPYSRHKVSAERVLDDLEARRPGEPVVTRMRPGLVLQREAGSALLRYGLPAAVPARVLRHVPVVPLDRSLAFQVVHADDVAAAVVASLHGRAPGAFNLVADPVVRPPEVAAALHARWVHVPRVALRAAAAAAFAARLSPLDPGWIDLAFAVPLLDAGRATDELDWRPERSASAALDDAVAGMATAAGTASPALRPRTVAGTLLQAARGPRTRQRLP